MATRVNCKLVAYRRGSTQKQGRSGLGLEARDAAIQAYAAQTGCTVVGEFTEVETGKNSDRPQLAKAINCAKRNRAVLVIAKLDRLSRKVYFISGLMESGVDFFAADCPNTTDIVWRLTSGQSSPKTKAASARQPWPLSPWPKSAVPNLAHQRI